MSLPVGAVGDWERFEGMRVTLPQQLTVTETFTLGRFGEVSLSVGGRLFNPTSIVAPGAPALAQQDLNNRSRILLDDGNNQQNIDPTIYPVGGLSASNTLRSGYTTSGAERHPRPALQPLSHPAGRAGVVQRRPTRGRRRRADVGGSLKVASHQRPQLLQR